MTLPFDFAPQQIALRDMRQGAITNVAVLVKRTDGKKLVISKAEAGVNFIRTRLEPLEELEHCRAGLGRDEGRRGAAAVRRDCARRR